MRLHIVPLLGARRLNQLTKPMVEDYRDQLHDSGRSRAKSARTSRSKPSFAASVPVFIVQKITCCLTVYHMVIIAVRVYGELFEVVRADVSADQETRS